MLAIDWGTSSFRAYRIAPDGAAREKREAAMGILNVRGGDFAAAFDGQVGDWLDAGEAPVVMCGMIGSRQGWVEAPYAECPAGIAELAARLCPVRWRTCEAWIVPGLVDRSAGVPDVMRGEETQLIGALAQLGPGSHVVCLPGTHSKWARVADGRIAGFRTHMTGEVFGVLKEHSILGRLMAEGAEDESAFEEGLGRARAAGGLLHHLFGARTRGLFDELPATALSSYLSGMLVGHELAAEADAAGTVHIIGAPRLAALYARGLRRLGKVARVLDPDVAVTGLAELARNLPRKTV
jgi:2-dehydro-3-deoxygalactonokinase